MRGSRHSIATLLALSLPVTAAAKADLDAAIAQSAGFLAGDGFHDEAGPASWTELELRPRARLGDWRLGLPFDFSHRQTYGFALSESLGKAGVKARVRVGAQRMLLYAGVYGAWRPGWLDPYQPDAEGEPTPTHRHSYLSPRLRAKWSLLPWSGHRLSLETQLRRPDYREDPDYDPELAPTHIIPGDHLRASLAGTWRWEHGAWRLEAGSSGDYRAYLHTYARDAGTGLTHASSDEPNPQYRVLDIEPRLRLRWEPEPFGLRLGYGHEFVTDLFEGYYSYRGHHPSLGLDWEGEALSISARSQLWLRRYGPDSYAQGGSHPALDEGERRWDRRGRAGIELALRLGERWELGSELEAGWRETNFPDYVPGVFPSSSSDYTIDWDWRTWQTMVGLRFEG